MTFKVMVQPPAGILLPLARVTVPEPAVAATPTQVPPRLFGVETTIAPGVVGKVSVKALDKTIALALMLPSVKVSKVVPPDVIEPEAKVLVIVGLFNTVKLTGPEPVPPLTCVVVTALTLLGFAPSVELVT